MIDCAGILMADGGFTVGSLWPFAVTFATLLACGLGFPIPEELPVVYAGIWMSSPEAQGLGMWRWLMLPICILGVVIGDGFLYGMGRLYGPRLFEVRFFRRLFPSEKRARVERNFHKYGVNILLFARLLPGIRGPIFITAGMMRLPLKRFLLADGLYAIPGVSLLFFLSWWFGTTFSDLVTAFEHRLDHLRPLILLLFLTAVAAYLLYNFYKKPVSEGDPQEIPLLGPQMAKRLSGTPPTLPSTNGSTGVTAAEPRPEPARPPRDAVKTS